MILNTTTILNNTIGITLNQTWEEYEDVNAMWTEAKELLEVCILCLCVCAY